MIEEKVPAPFRNDLKLYPGPREADGWPTFNIYDPVAAKYFKISWEESYIYKLAQPKMTLSDIVEEVKKYSHIDLTEEEVESFFQQAALAGLLQRPKSSEEVALAYEKQSGSFLKWLLFNYLYIRIPLVKPDRFLTATLPYVKWLWSPPLIVLYVLLSIGGLLAIATRWEEYSHTFVYFFSLEGFTAYLIAIIAVKIVHEMAHAYTAANYGVAVPSMGVALLLLWPVLYTDVTHSWKLSRRRQRLAISGAGIVAETVIAGLSTVGWAVSSAGLFQSICFVLSAVTWLRSLFINFNPVLRFDGYYLLCDLWGIDNLRPRAFAFTRWQLHRWLFGIKTDCPEDALPQKTLSWMLVYSLISWAYLLVLYTVIALFVYHKFTKALGVFLFAVEIAVFFVWPVVTEMKYFFQNRKLFHWNLRSVSTCCVLALLLAWLIIPMRHYERFAAITAPTEMQVIYASLPGTIKEIHVKRGQWLEAGDPILELENPRVARDLAIAETELRHAEETLRLLASETELKSLIGSARAQLEVAKEELEKAQGQVKKLRITAKQSGHVFEWDDDICSGQVVEKNQTLGKLADKNQVKFVAFVEEDRAGFLPKDGQLSFQIPGTHIEYTGKLIGAHAAATRILPYPSLASIYQGPLAAAKGDDEQIFLQQSYFQMEALIELLGGEEPPPFGKTGELKVLTGRESLMMRALRNFASLFLRESTF